MSKLKKIIKYPVRVIKHSVHLPQYARIIQEQQQHIIKLNSLLDETVEKNEELNARTTNEVALLHSLDDRFTDLKESLKGRKNSDKPVEQRVVNNTVADNHSLDHFYKLFEDKFRGSEQDIKHRLTEYIPLFEGREKKLEKLPILDIGCGRGEFLSLMKDHKKKALGVDMNESMVSRANSLGYKAIQDDAVNYLASQKASSFSAITGFHIVEHIPFESLIDLFDQCYKSIAPGGFVLFETPNPNNLMVGASNFYMDPSHLNPIPPELLAFAIESAGFQVEILRLHPVKEQIEHPDEVVKDIMGMVYGPRDYAVIGRKY